MATSAKSPSVLGSSGAGNAWTNLSNAAGTPSGSSFATLAADGAAKQVDVTSASLAFNIPAGSTINGITVAAYEANQNEILTYDLSVSVLKNATITETKTTTAITATAPTSFGSSTDKWSGVWTANDINQNMTIALAFTLAVGTRVLFGFDGIVVTVYYTVNGVRGRQVRGRLPR